ncbi:hypothetical protein BJ878DRAFT_483656 [Calycina marina]|uniref:Uncharacterized protein n=1 Tax=Calycina marina TaxID=1763456 RepID=A0A9P7YWF4_9HELO|nr:hypothetical protein BJ878DRAFT_483656 [Calycina marina]
MVSSKSKTKPTPMLAYRDDDNHAVKYVLGTNIVPTTVSYRPEDSDNEALLQPQGEIDEESLQRFTATGRPMQPLKYRAMQTMAGDMFSLPVLLPKRYTDDSIIPAIITNVIPSIDIAAPRASMGRRASFMKRLKSGMSEEKQYNGRITKVVYMPRREYLMHFACNEKGEYSGTKPKKEWTEDELNEKYKEFQLPPKKPAMFGGMPS